MILYLTLLLYWNVIYWAFYYSNYNNCDIINKNVKYWIRGVFMKIGQEFKVQQDKGIESLFGDETLKIKKGDKAIQLKDRIHYLSWEAAGFFWVWW